MRILPAALVFGAAGAGYVYTNEELSKSLSPATWISEDSTPARGRSETLHGAELVSASLEEIVAVAGPENLGLEEVFRFDLTPRSITERWSRVTTGLGDVNYQGYRVPLVTGTTSSDLAGSLTYYFDSQPRLRRITFLGTTGAPERVVQFMVKNYGFRRSPTGNPRVVTYRTHYGRAGLLEITAAAVLDRNQAHQNYTLELAIER
ncbi:MAG: DUF6690 family protein [Planctomycetales bacterium]